LQLCQIGTNTVQVDRLRGFGYVRAIFADVECQQCSALEQRLILRDTDLSHDAGDAGSDDLFHLHRFHDCNLLSPLDGVAYVDVDAHHGPRYDRTDRLCPFRQRNFAL